MFVAENARLFLKLYYKPLSAMSGILDRGNWFLGAALAVAIAALLQVAYLSRTYDGQIYDDAGVPAVAQGSEPVAPASPASDGGAARGTQDGGPDTAATEPDDDALDQPQPARHSTMRRPGYGQLLALFFSPPSILGTTLGLAVLYVPATILLIVMFGQPGSFSVIFKRDYVSLLTCTLMAWAAAHLPVAIAELVLGSLKIRGLSTFVASVALWAASEVYFGLLMVCALRTLFGASFVKATATVCLAWLPLLAEPILMSTRLIYYLASPFLLFYLYQYFRGDVSDLGFAVSSRQGYRRHLDAALVNPRDAEAHYQLGLVYQYRHQYTEAIERFKKAIEIDRRETDSHYQLGVIARSQGRLQEAIDYFSTVVAQDDKHALSEIWREIGATYLAANMLAEARDALERFVERRPYDPQGLYFLGETLEKLREAGSARAMFERCVDAAKTTPYYRRGEVRKWRRLAEKRAQVLRINAERQSA